MSINSRSLLKLMSTELVMLSNRVILCHPLLHPPSVFPSIRGFPKCQFFASGGQRAVPQPLQEQTRSGAGLCEGKRKDGRRQPDKNCLTFPPHSPTTHCTPSLQVPWKEEPLLPALPAHALDCPHLTHFRAPCLQ